MADYVILTDSSCDLPAELADQMQLTVLPLTVDMDGKLYRNYLDGREIGFHEFFEQVVTAKSAKTSAVTSEQFMEVLEPLCQAGVDVLYLAFSSGLSGTYNSGAIAMRELSEKYPERKLYAVDSLCASLGEGLFVDLCHEKKEAGMTIDELRDYAESLKPHICHWFTVNDLMFLKRGGRVSTATAIVGSVLSIKPVMHMDNEGHLIKVDVARGRKASLRALVAKMEKLATDPEKQRVYICHGDCLQDAEYVASLVREKFGITDIRINYVGPVIGAHTGPGVVSLFFVGSER